MTSQRSPTIEDRLAIRAAPPGWPVMHQTWDGLLFLHWPIPEEALRPLVPGRLAIDTFDGTAWISVTPFAMRGLRPALLPPLPVLSRALELNVRTYVHLDGVPGVWFLSLDINHTPAVAGARLAFALPYYRARMRLERQGEAIHYTSRRIHPGAPPAGFEARWAGGEPLPPAQPGSLAFFLVERYCLYAARGRRLERARIAHDPWPLRRAELLMYASTMIASHGLTPPGSEPLLHLQAAPLRVRIWPPTRVGSG